MVTSVAEDTKQDGKLRLDIRSEYAPLEQVVMAAPHHFRVVEPINSAQEQHFSRTPPRIARLVAEQSAFVAALTDAGVEVIWAPEQVDSPFQLNTRDVGAVIGSELVVGRMRCAVRHREPDAVRELLQPHGVSLVELPAGTFEGGDVLVDGDIVYVGLSQRTDAEGLRQFARHLHEWGIRLVPVPLRGDVLHLDVALNIIAPGVALAYRPAFPEGLPEPVEVRHEVIAVSDEEHDRLGSNVFAIRPDLVVADARNHRVVELLRERGLQVVDIDYAETTKIGGSFRCMTLPLRRREPAA